MQATSKCIARTFLFLASALFATAPSIAQDVYTWTGSASLNWNTTDANWDRGAWIDPATAPFHTAVFAGAGTGDINVSGERKDSAITITADGYSFGGNKLGNGSSLASLTVNDGSGAAIAATFNNTLDWVGVDRYLVVGENDALTVAKLMGGSAKRFYEQGSGALDEAARTTVFDFQRKPDWSFLSWDNRCLPQGEGLRIQAPDSKGGAGYNLSADASGQDDAIPQLALTIGPSHQAKAIRLTLNDADGTRHEFRFSLADLPLGQTASVGAEKGASLREPSKTGDAGKVPGFDAAHVAQVILQGDWTDAAVDVTVSRLDLVAPDADALAARETRRAAAVQKAETDRIAAEQQARALRASRGGCGTTRKTR